MAIGFQKVIDSFVMAGLVPAIHVFLAATLLRRHARHKAGHDGLT
jgi:hypothetical protein